MKELINKKIWFLTGTQYLYGEKALEQISKNAELVVKGLNESKHIPLQIIFKPILKSQEANNTVMY